MNVVVLSYCSYTVTSHSIWSYRCPSPRKVLLQPDLLISNPAIIKKYHYTSDFLVKDGSIQEEKVGGESDNIWQMVGISYWNEVDGHKLS